MATDGIESAWQNYPGYEITATLFDGVGRVRCGEVLLAESDACLVVAESDHLDQLYFPVDTIDWQYLESTDHHTVCPFKGEASYWTVKVGDASFDDVAWAYPDPFDEVAAIQGHVAFYVDRELDVSLTEQWSDDARDHIQRKFPLWGSARDLVRLMDVQPTTDGRFVAPTYPDPPLGTFFDWAKERARRDVVEGGQLLGDLIVAASKAAEGQRVTSAYAIFCKAASFDAVLDVDVEVLRRGRTASTVEVRISQHDALRAAGMAMLQSPTGDFIRHAAPMPDVPGPYECEPLDMATSGRDLRVVDGAYHQDLDEVGPPELYVWARYRNPPELPYLRQALVAQPTTHWTIAASMRPYPGVTEAAAHVTLSTGILSTAINFHDDIDPSEWMLYANPSIYAGRGAAQGEGRVYSQDGRLIASYSVQAMIREFSTPPALLGKDANTAM